MYFCITIILLLPLFSVVKPKINMYVAFWDTKDTCLALVLIPLFCKKKDFKYYVWHLYFLPPSCFPSCCPTHMLSITITYLIKRMRPSGMNVLFSLWITDSQDDNTALQMSNVNFETKSELTETSPCLKQDLKARPFSLIMPQLVLAYFPKQYQRIFVK